MWCLKPVDLPLSPGVGSSHVDRRSNILSPSTLTHTAHTVESYRLQIDQPGSASLAYVAGHLTAAAPLSPLSHSTHTRQQHTHMVGEVRGYSSVGPARLKTTPTISIPQSRHTRSLRAGSSPGHGTPSSHSTSAATSASTAVCARSDTTLNPVSSFTTAEGFLHAAALFFNPAPVPTPHPSVSSPLAPTPIHVTSTVARTPVDRVHPGYRHQVLSTRSRWSW